MATSIDTKEERTRLNDYVKTQTNTTFNEINQEVATEMEDFRKVVMFSNKMNTTKANEELGDIQKVITYIAINSMSAGMEQGKAIKKATDYINNNFEFAGGGTFGDDTYFIPKNYDNKRLSAKHIEFIEQKAKIIKNKYLQDFNMKTFESNNEEISNTELNEEMLDQAKDNGVWINNADGSGIVFAIEFADGSLGLVENEQGELLQINFDDDSYKLPGTDIIINMGQIDEKRTNLIMANISFGLDTNKYAQQTGFDQFQTGMLETLGEISKDAWKYNPVSSALRLSELEINRGRIDNEPLIDRQKLNDEYGKYNLFFEEDEKQSTVDILVARKKTEIERQSIIQRGPQGFLPATAKLATSLVTSIADPINLAMMFIPIVGQARFASMVARAGLTGARFRKGAIEGLVGIAAVEPLVYTAATREQSDYDLVDSLIAVTFGGVLGGGLHVGIGKLKDFNTRRKFIKK